ncbi:hypothetical protein Tco_0968721 [Tanacetum coccineum]
MRKCGCQGVGGQFCGGCHTASSLEAAQVRIASKQGRINAIDADEDITLVSVQNIDEEMFDVDVLDALEALKTSNPKVKGIVFQDPAEFDEEERLTREKVEKEKEANIALIEECDDIQAKIDADYQLAERLQEEEQEELYVEEKAKLFQQLIEQRRKHFAAKSAEEKRNKPPTQAQQRKSYKMLDKAYNRVNTFVDFRTDLVEGSLKRAGEELIQEGSKKQKVDDDKETTKLKQCMEIIPNEEEIYMLIEKRCPLTPPKITDMLNKKLQVDYSNEIAYQLLKLLTK